MRIAHLASSLALVGGLLFGQAASAVPIKVTIQGTVVKDIFAPSVYGSTQSFPFQFSFQADSHDAVVFTAGTPVIVSSGAHFNSDAFLFSSADLTNFLGPM